MNGLVSFCMKTLYLCIGASVICALIIPGMPYAANTAPNSSPQLASYYPYPNYRFGDCNGDGWCNFGDVQTMVYYFRGFSPEPCMPAADVNNSGSFNGIDVPYLVGFLGGGQAPLNECPWPIGGTQAGGLVVMDSCIGGPGDTIDIKIYLMTDSILSLNLCFAYDNLDITGILQGPQNPAFNYWILRTHSWQNLPPDNNDTLNTASIIFEMSSGSPINANVDTLTWAFTIRVVLDSNTYSGYHPLIPESHPYMGPPKIYWNAGWSWSEPSIVIGPYRNMVKVRQSLTIKQSLLTGATGLSFKIWEKYDDINILTWNVSAGNFATVNSNRAYQPEPYFSQIDTIYGPPLADTSDNGRHAIDVTCANGYVARGDSVKIDITLWLTYLSTMNFYGPIWNGWSALTDEAEAFPDFGWQLDYPDSAAPQRCGHAFSLANYDSTKSVNLRDVSFFGTMTEYDSLSMINPHLFNSASMDLWINPGESTNYDFIGYDYMTGNVNCQGGFTGLDVVYAVAYFKGGPLPCYYGDCPPLGAFYLDGDVNASCSFTGLDITYMVAFLKGGPALRPCPLCPPGGPPENRCLFGGHIYGKYTIFDPADPDFELKAIFDSEILSIEQ